MDAKMVIIVWIIIKEWMNNIQLLTNKYKYSVYYDI